MTDINDRMKAAARPGWQYIDGLGFRTLGGAVWIEPRADGTADLDIGGNYLSPTELRDLAAQLLAVADALEPTPAYEASCRPEWPPSAHCESDECTRRHDLGVDYRTYRPTTPARVIDAVAKATGAEVK